MKNEVNDDTATDSSARCKTGITNVTGIDDDSSLGLGVAAEYARARARWRVRQLSRPKSTANPKVTKETPSAMLHLSAPPPGGSRRRSFASSTSAMERTASAATLRRSVANNDMTIAASSAPKTIDCSGRLSRAAAPQDELRRGEGHLLPAGTDRVRRSHGDSVDATSATPSVGTSEGEGGGGPTTLYSAQSHRTICTTSLPPELEEDDDSASPFQSALSMLGITDPMYDTDDSVDGEDQLRDTVAELRRTIPLTVSTAGLRPGRENALLDSFHQLVAADQSLSRRCNARLSKWKEFSNRIALRASSLLRQRDEALALAEGGRRSAIEEAERVKAEAERAIAEAQEQIRAVAEAGRAAREEVLRVKETLAEQLEERLLAVRRETEKAAEQRVEEETTKVKQEREAQADKFKAVLAEEKDRYEVVLAAEKDRCEALQRQLFEEKDVSRRAEAELDLQAQQFREDIKTACKTLRRELQSGFQQNLAVVEEQRDVLQIALERERQGKREETEECEKRRRNELEGVEAKVKDIMWKKDERLRDALARAEYSERWASSMERLLTELEIGFLQDGRGETPTRSGTE